MRRGPSPGGTLDGIGDFPVPYRYGVTEKQPHRPVGVKGRAMCARPDFFIENRKGFDRAVPKRISTDYGCPACLWAEVTQLRPRTTYLAWLESGL